MEEIPAEKKPRALMAMEEFHRREDRGQAIED
jgi:hypothetical protein